MVNFLKLVFFSSYFRYGLFCCLFIIGGGTTRAVLLLDNVSETSHSGEPASVQWNHTIGSGSNRIVFCSVSGLAVPNAPKWSENTMTAVLVRDQLKVYYYLNPSVGVGYCEVGGGNIKVGGGVSFSGVDTSMPIGASLSENGGTSPNTMTLTIDSGNFRLDVMSGNREDNTNPVNTFDLGVNVFDDVVPQNQFRVGLFGNYSTISGDGIWTFTSTRENDFISLEINAMVSADVVASASPDMVQAPGLLLLGFILFFINFFFIVWYFGGVYN